MVVVLIKLEYSGIGFKIGQSSLIPDTNRGVYIYFTCIIEVKNYEGILSRADNMDFRGDSESIC